MKKITFLFIFYFLCQSITLGQIKFTIYGDGPTDTELIITGSGSATTNGIASNWTSAGESQVFGSNGFNYTNSNLNFVFFNLTGDLILSNGATPVTFSKIGLDDDTGSDYDDFILDASNITAITSNTTYTLSGSATFTLTDANFGDLTTGSWTGNDFSGLQGGFNNFSTSDIIIEIVQGAPTSPPELNTSDASSITKTSAILAGNVTSQGTSSVTERGVLYSNIDTEPEIGDIGVTKEIEGGTTNGVFSETISNLTKGTTYYYRAYAINSQGTAYGTIKNFTTLNDIPTLTTTDATVVAATSATLAGNISLQGDSPVTERGIVYSTTDTNPKIGDTNVIKNNNGFGTGAFSKNITSFTANTGYFYRAYATNSQGTAYGDVKRFNFNHALNFDGINDRVVIQDNPAFGSSVGFTAEAWINPDELSTQTIISQYDDNQKAFAFILLASGKIEFTITTNGSTDQYFESTTNISAGTWSHVALTYDGATMKAYINGIAAGTKAVGGTMHNSTANIEIGARNNAHFFNGKIDEVRIWNIALLENQINSNKGKSFPVHANISGLIASYNMNQGIAFGDNTSIATLKNNGSNNLNGTLENFTKTSTSSNFVKGVTGAFGSPINNNTFSTTGNWSTASNWSLGIVPTQIDKATIGNGKTVTIDVDDLKIDDFKLETGAILAIPKDKEITIQNSFTSSGSLELSSDSTNSGVLFVEGTSSGTVTYKRGGLIANKWSIITPPVAGQKIKEFAENVDNNIRKRTDLTPNKYAIAYYDDSQTSGNKWVYYFADMDVNLEFEVGKSYIISRATDGEVSFTGTLTTESSTKTLITNQWNAIGNPFTTYFPANKNNNSSFLNDNSSSLDDTYQSLYVWDNAQNKYIAVTEVDATNRSLTPGQGFFVRLKNGQTEITFNEEKRSTKPATGNNNFGKTKNTTPSIELKINDGKNTINTFVKYFQNATSGFDKGYDIGNFNSDGLDLFTRLVNKENKTNYTVQSLPKDNYENMIIPVGIKTTANKEVTFSLVKKNIPNTYKIFLEDKITKSFTQLDVDNTSYKVTFTEDTNSTDRFNLHVTPQVLSVDDVNTNNLNIFLSKKRTLNITGYNFSNKATLKVITLLGQEIISKKIENNTIQLPSTIKTGIYIVKLNYNSGSLTKKIILE